MTDVATLKTRLLEAELAEHKLVCGSKVEQVQQTVGGVTSMVTYARTKLPDLRDYIGRLKAEIGMLSGSGQGVRRPIHYT